MMLGQPEVAAAIAAVDMVAGTFQKLTSAMVDFQQKSNPGLFAVYNQAVDNLQAALGKLFEPFVQSFIPVVNMLNQVFTALQGRLSGVFGVLGEFVQVGVEGLKILFDVWTEGFDLVRPFVDMWVDGMKQILTWIKYVIAAVQVLTGTGGKNTATTKAVTGGAIVGVEDIGRQFREAALNQGGGQTGPSMAEDIAKIRSTIIEWYNKVQGAPAAAAVNAAPTVAAASINPVAAAIQWIWN